MTLFDFDTERSPCIPTLTTRKIYYMPHACQGAHAAMVSHTQHCSEDSTVISFPESR